MPPRDPRTSQAAAPRTAEAIAPVRLAVARTTMPEDPTDPGALRESGAQVRQFMHEAAAAWARLAQFPEGAIAYPGKYVMSSGGPGALAEADWSRIDWDVMREEAGQVAALAGQLGIWTVFGSLHPSPRPAARTTPCTSSPPRGACSPATFAGTACLPYSGRKASS